MNLDNYIVAPWMARLSFQQQTVVMLATRGPDGIRKRHPAKQVHIAYRGTVFRAAERGRFLNWGEEADSFMSMEIIASVDAWNRAVKEFFAHVDELPHHYTNHLAHAAQIIGYRHPDKDYRRAWSWFYLQWCDDCHVTPETHEEMNARLGDWGNAKERLEEIGYEFPIPGKN